MAGHHLGLNGRSISESPKPMNASLYPTSNSLVKDSGTSVRKLNETFPESPKSARKRSGNEHTSRMRLAEIHTRPVRFFWFHASGEILPTTNIDTIPSFSTTPLLWCDTLSRENESRSVVQAFACKLEENGSQELVAVKQVLSRDPEEKRKAFEEVELLAKARHRHIVACLGSYLYRDKLCIIQFPVAKYNLAQYLQARSNYIQFRNVQEEGEIEHMRRLVSYFACLCTAVKYIHELGIKHRDIKPENILIDRYNTVLLTDFDISKQRDIAEKTDGPTVCTVKYSSRDVCLGVPRDFSSDVFSLGCVFMEMATIALGRTIKSLYEAVGMGSETGFEVTYWQSVENEKARGWFSELNSASSTKDKERSAVETHSLRLPGHDHLARIEAMMSNTEGARPSLADIHQTFGSLRDQCDDCVVPIATEQTRQADRDESSKANSHELSSSITNGAVAGPSKSNRLSHELTPLPTIDEASQAPSSTLPGNAKIPKQHSVPDNPTMQYGDSISTSSMIAQRSGKEPQHSRAPLLHAANPSSGASVPQKSYDLRPRTILFGAPDSPIKPAAASPPTVSTGSTPHGDIGHTVDDVRHASSTTGAESAPDSPTSMVNRPQGSLMRGLSRRIRARSRPRDGPSSSDSDPGPRMYRPGKDVRYLGSIANIPGRRIIQYDEETAAFSVVTKDQLDFTQGILIKLPRGDGWKFKTATNYVNLWENLELSDNFRRVFGGTRTMFHKGRFPHNQLMAAINQH